MIIRKEEMSECIGLGCLRRKLLRELEDGFTKKEKANIEEEIRKKLIQDLQEGKLKIPA